MHESGVITRLLDVALAEAERREARLVKLHLRLGALAGGSPAHLREHFEIELMRRELAGVGLELRVDEDHPGGIELTSVELEAQP